MLEICISEYPTTVWIDKIHRVTNRATLGREHRQRLGFHTADQQIRLHTTPGYVGRRTEQQQALDTRRVAVQQGPHLARCCQSRAAILPAVVDGHLHNRPVPAQDIGRVQRSTTARCLQVARKRARRIEQSSRRRMAVIRNAGYKIERQCRDPGQPEDRDDRQQDPSTSSGRRHSRLRRLTNTKMPRQISAIRNHCEA